MTTVDGPADAAKAEAAALAALHRHNVHLRVGKQEIRRGASSAQVRRAVAARNDHHRSHELDELQALNPEWVDPDEVLPFLIGLARQPTEVLARVAAAGPLDLAAPALKLHVQDGFGVHGLARAWTLASAGPLGIEPSLDLDDAAADVRAAAAAEAKRQAESSAAAARLAALARTSPDYGPAFRAQAQSRVRIAAVQRVHLAAARRLLGALPATVPAGLPPRVDLEREVDRLEAALRSAPPAGGMPGGVRPLPE